MLSAIIKRSLFLWVLALSACTIQLVPSYDQALVEGLDEANTEALTLFAAVEGGSPKEKFPEFEDEYAETIGKFDSLQQRAANRQVPPLATRLAKVNFVRDFCPNATSCVNASPASLSRVLKVLRDLRDEHRSMGLQADTISPYRRDYVTAIGQALTVENALKR
jgi:hypothetical protein